MLREIRLHGALGDRFGREFRLDVVSPLEAVRALGTLLPGFRQAISEGAYRIIRGALHNGLELDEDSLAIRLGRAKILHIVPVIAGRGGRGTGKIIAGIAIASLAFAAPFALGLAGGLSASAVGVSGFLTFGQIAGIGIALGLTGVSQMLTKTTNAGDSNSKTNTSYMFSTPENVTAQGGCVPVAFGRVLVGSTVISSALAVEQV